MDITSMYARWALLHHPDLYLVTTSLYLVTTLSLSLMVQALPYPEDRAATLSQMPVQQKVFTIAGVADEKERHRVLGERLYVHI